MFSLNNRYDCGSMAEFWSGTKIIGNHFEVECQWNKTWLPELPECKGSKHLIIIQQHPSQNLISKI